jgi:hypothetical protein
MSRGQAEGKIVRRQRALDLRIAGQRYRAIAAELGVNHVQAYRDVRAALAEINTKNHEKAEQLRDLELRRYDQLMSLLWTKCEAGDVQAARAVVALMERRAKLLGLDAPTKVGLSGDGEGGPVTVVHQYLP